MYFSLFKFFMGLTPGATLVEQILLI